MADGQVLIDSKLDAKGVSKGAEEIKEIMNRTAEIATKAADNIEKGFKNVNYKEAFDKMPQALQQAYVKIEAIRADESSSEKQRAAQIAKIYEELGLDQEQANKKAWAAMDKDAEKGSHNIIDSLGEISDAAKDTSKVVEDTGDALDSISDGAGGASTSLKDLFKVKVGGDLLVSSLKKVAELCIEIGKQAIEAAADVQASNAQFEQTFKGIESTARETLNSIADESGITATRMQGSFTKIYAFTKSVGGDTERAMDISSRAMKVAADSAAYYDRSLEETTETLMSFLKGNYENDAALGIAATETTRNAKANELYAKSFKDLSESQKVDVLLAMVEAGNEASGALGQAARESDQWANVTSELAEEWKQLLAILGSPLISAFTPILQGISAVLKEITKSSASGNLKSDLKEVTKTAKAAEAAYKKRRKKLNGMRLRRAFIPRIWKNWPLLFLHRKRPTKTMQTT